jgi:hypothetical protein
MALWAIASLMLALVFVRTMLRLRRDSARWPEVSIGRYHALLSPSAGPAVIGFAKPRIVIPAWAMSLDQHARELMLHHEAEHIRARDPRTLVIAGALLTVFPWNAALWLMVRQLRRSMEFDCDARVIRAVGDASEYGRVLLAVGERFIAPLPLAASLSAPRPLLEQRIDAMSAPRFRHPLRVALPFVALALLATTAATRAPRPAPLGPLAFATPQVPVPQRATHVIPATASHVVRAESSLGVRPVRTRIDAFGATHDSSSPAVPVSSVGRGRVVALAREKFPAVVRGELPADFIMMLFDDNDVFLRGFSGQGHVMIHVDGDTNRANAQRAAQQTALLLYGASGLADRAAGAGNAAAARPPSAARKFTGYIVGFGPWSSRGNIGVRDLKTSNTASGLSEVSLDSSGIAGIPASQVTHVELFRLGELGTPEWRLQILAVHLNDFRPDSVPELALQVRGPGSYDVGTRQVPDKKKATVKRLVVLPLPIPPGYVMEACFDVASTGDAKLLVWAKSKDTAYDRKIDESLKKYLFNPATLNGVAVRDTVCVKAKDSKSTP